MARVALIDPDGREQLAPLAAKFREGRRGRLLGLYRVLLHNPKLADSWYQHMNAVRWQTALDGRLREIVIIRVAILNNAAYALKQHVPKLAAAEGLSAEECRCLHRWQAASTFSGRERAALAFTDTVTKNCQASDAVISDLRTYFNEAEIVDLAVMVGTYNMHTRVTNALALDVEQD